MTVCACGCGERTRVYNGVPNRWIKNHDKRRSSYYEEDPDTGCWIWQGAMHPAGYGYGWDRDLLRTDFAHRIFYRSHRGEIPPSREIHHACENRRCVNPDHLKALTLSEHAATKTIPGPRKLTQEQVAKIRERVARGEQQKVLALEFGVSKNAVWKLVHGQTWKVAA